GNDDIELFLFEHSDRVGCAGCCRYGKIAGPLQKHFAEIEKGRLVIDIEDPDFFLLLALFPALRHMPFGTVISKLCPFLRYPVKQVNKGGLLAARGFWKMEGEPFFYI
ncbi:MAG: hypothetical protein NTV84_03845, partial [Methanoregula sp.]|nr:hypothetical protein [Methanoregula sp.]